MLFTGVMNPESRMHGTPTVKHPKKACCCVEANEDTISPMLLTESENSSMVTYSTATDPTNGTLRNPIMEKKKMVPCTRPTTQPGISFPQAISTGLAGETSIWSNVPSSRSRATVRPVMIIPIKKLIVPIRFGRMNQRKSAPCPQRALSSSTSTREGLACTKAGVAVASPCTICWTYCVKIWAVLDRRPSSNNCTSAGTPRSTLAEKSFWKCITISTS